MKKEIEVNGKKIKPVDLTAKLLFPFWSPDKGEKDFTVLDILIEGNENGKKTSHHYFVFDEYDPGEDNSSMARTTGFTAVLLQDICWIITTIEKEFAHRNSSVKMKIVLIILFPISRIKV